MLQAQNELRNLRRRKMKIINSLNEREIELLNKINIKIEDRDYNLEEIDELKEKNCSRC